MNIPDLLYTIPAFLLAFSSLVVVHELGHLLAARWCGVKVLRFSLGWGKPLWSHRFGKSEIEWVLAPYPLGGYVTMLDARNQDVSTIAPQDLPYEFTRQKVWKRIIILAAGPFANFLLAISIFTAINMVGVNEPNTRLRQMEEGSLAYQSGLRGGQRITTVDGEAVQAWSQLRKKVMLAIVEKRRLVLDTESADPNSSDPARHLLTTVTLPLDGVSETALEGDFMTQIGLEVFRPAAVLGKVVAGGPAALAGLQSGDRVVAIDGKPVQDGLALIMAIRAAPGKQLQLSLQRGQENLTLVATPTAEVPNGAQGKAAKAVGRLHVEVAAMPEMTNISYDAVAAMSLAVSDAYQTSVMTLKMLGKMLMGQVSWKNLTGPITIADYAGQTAKIGWQSYLSFIGFVSLSLGVMNLLPIPMLDGGYLLYYSLEILRGRPLPERFVEICQRAGVGILVSMMVIAIFNDIARQLP